ncbi:MAG: ABC transporter ATP-binding protein [Bryobacteraceae bacterium]|jgi:putative ABC transport system ATP-binding protein
MQPIVAVRDLTKTYAQGAAASRALNGVDLDIYPRQVTLLMGPSGSGKTTLVSIMGCILRPSSGSVKVAGREVTRLSEKELPAIRLRHMGFVFQGFNLFPTLTAVENVEIALELKRVPRGERRMRAAALLDEVGLNDKHRAYPADLSGGQKQRVAIARALAGDPDVILADEPTAALDKTSGRTVLEMLRRLAHDKGRAVVIVTHDARTLDYADRVVDIEDGRIAAEREAGEERYLVAEEG